jgi:murein DD-endopeptidase MepM/ murein hydrolase activator NlpD
LQIRLKHSAGNTVYHTIYAHLSKSLVNKGQKVAAGDLIGLADNTGNSFGSHLHLTLKIDGAKTPGYPAGIVDPWPYLQGSISAPDLPLPDESGLVVYTSMAMNLRSGPNLDSPIAALLPAGEALSVLGKAEQIKPKIGVEGEWLQVKTSAGTTGYVAAWLMRIPCRPFRR